MTNSAPLDQPSIAAQLMSARGLTTAAEDEENDNIHIYVTGAVLKTKAEKRADLAVQVAKAKKAEAEEAARMKARTSAPAKGKGKAHKATTPPVESEEDGEDGDEEIFPVEKAAAEKAISRKVKGDKKAAFSPVNEENDKDEEDANKEPVKKSKANPRKRPAPVADTEDADADAENAPPKPAPKKRAKSTPAGNQNANDGSPTKPGSSNTSGGTGTVAPKIAKRGGAAPKWLKDEDDLVKQMIVDNPTWPMPAVYREYSRRIANTPYQREGQATVEHRADFVEFPKRKNEGDKERRKYDIAWRTYESVRQHCEKFKANVSSAISFPPYTWDPARVNLATGQPKRAPPPRPDFFNDKDNTPVPPADGTNELLTSVSSVARSSAAGPSATVPSAAGHSNQAATSTASTGPPGWNAVNRPAKFVPYVPKGPKRAATQTVAPAAPGDCSFADLDDFVAQQSASDPSVEEEGDEDEEMEDE
jgi:hypothetical protein